jgi:peptidoglycan/xylan/chitin deacetylase (PgdA/CDA1 family)
MLFRIIKLAISIVVLAGMSFIRALVRIFGCSPAPVCVIIYYHSVASRELPAFRTQMELLLRLSTPVDLDNLEKLQPGRRYTAVTFDDAFADTVENAIPELVSRRIPARIFVTVGVLGHTAKWWPERSPEHQRPIATPEQIRNLPRDLISIGSHTMTHPHLSSLDQSSALYELGESRHELQRLMGQCVGTISFPYGDYSGDVVRWSQTTGYTRAFTIEHRLARSSQSTYLIGRFKTDPSDWPVEFAVKLLGGYAWHPYAVAAKSRLRRWVITAPLRSVAGHH